MCGVFGIFNHENAAALVTLGLHSLQHRGQEGDGIVTTDGSKFYGVRRPRLVSEHFNSPEIVNKLIGNSAVGHVRYSTTGASITENIQPLFAELFRGGFAIAHNGNLTNAKSLKNKLVESGAIFQTTSDTEAILHLVSKSNANNVVEKLIDALSHIEGAYALTIMTKKKLIGVRDPYGIRPLVLGDLDGSPILTSETCALDMVGAKYVRDVMPGEIVLIDGNGIKSIKYDETKIERQCLFERIYFARPDSVVKGNTVYTYRKNLGLELAREWQESGNCPAKNEAKNTVVVPIPDSGVPAALGFSQFTKCDYELGIIRNHYVGRSFIEPLQSLRQNTVKLKHSINKSAVKGKIVILIDDSLVRGTTAKQIVNMVFEAGAKEVHIGIACPPVKYPDFYGIDTPNQAELIAAKYSKKETENIIGATSIFFLSIEGTYKAMGYEGRNNETPQLTDHCFTNEYPVQPEIF
ncbi:MAG: amidophosphoribosyltransferase [Rhodospirillaceae bacterium]|nr:amidophosphoribosyltransferase [Rhodospirillaceae bacterium]